VGQAGEFDEAGEVMFGMKKRTRLKLYRFFTLIFLVVFILSVAAALLITGLQAPK
jgi:hypothetical protein